jgi:hypothetical protein
MNSIDSAFMKNKYLKEWNSFSTKWILQKLPENVFAYFIMNH